jgi:alpha-glucoside transport system substrate-binding protein
MAQIAYAATSFVFDASDEMPGAVGSGSFWREMTSWIGGETSLDSALRAIDASWPRD